jgi:TrwC relaxase
VVRLFPHRTNDVSYFTNDAARELDGVRDGGPGWWLRGNGDTRDPAMVERVLTTSERSQLSGYDVVIAAPRPISILLALNGEGARGVVDAHRASVQATMSYLEEHALVVRDRRNGEDRDHPATWESVVSFTHGLNRHGEPHLHDHVLIGARPAKQRNILDSRALYAHAEAADALYRSSLRYELSRRTPWSAWRSFEGIERVVGLDEGFRALWSGHHRERGEKLAWTREQTLDAWSRDRGRFESLGVVEPTRRDRNLLDEHRFAGALEGRSDVARRHLVTAWANAAPFGQDPRELARSINDLYPELTGRGVRERTIAVRDARMISNVREIGPRPLERVGFDEWRQRSRELVRSRDGRSR